MEALRDDTYRKITGLMYDTVGLAFHPWEMIKREAGMVRRVAGGAWGKVRRR